MAMVSQEMCCLVKQVRTPFLSFPPPSLPKRQSFLRENFGLVIWRGIMTKEKMTKLDGWKMLLMRCNAMQCCADPTFVVGVKMKSTPAPRMADFSPRSLYIESGEMSGEQIGR
jgi:hypothetical protein